MMIKKIRKFFKQILAAPQLWKKAGDKDFIDWEDK